jgi:hypothetical protein
MACIFTGLQTLAQQKKPTAANKKADSIAAVHRYKDNKVYKDSVAKQRKPKITSTTSKSKTLL